MKIIPFINKPSGTYKIEGNSFFLVTPNSSKYDSLGTPQRICLHATAGQRTTLYDDYHYNITEVGSNVFVFQTLSTSQKGQHLWGRNSNCIGITLNCLYDSDPPTEKMLDAMSLLVAELSAWKQIGINDLITIDEKKDTIDSHGREVLVSTGREIKVKKVLDHASYAKLDKYYPDRVDIEKYFKKVISKAEEYYKELKEGKRQFTFLEIIK